MVSGMLGFVYGVVCYVAFLGTFLYAIGFVGGVGVPKGIDSGPAGSLVSSLVVDLLLLALFAVQHSVMARPAFKAWLTRLVPRSVERSTYVLGASLALLLLFWQWRPLPAAVWAVREPVAAGVLWTVYALGWATVLFGTFMISHAHLFGLSQTWAGLRGRRQPQLTFQIRGFYRYVRHPLMLGFLIAFWSAPVMSAGHLVFAAATTAYILLATLAFEERDLARSLGEPYEAYRRTVPAFLPVPGRAAEAGDARGAVVGQDRHAEPWPS
jgi:methanethiol S-methyltransferase